MLFNFCKNPSIGDGEVAGSFQSSFSHNLNFSLHKDEINFSYDFRAQPSIVVHLFQVNTCFWNAES